jgi:cellulose synthase/poly-beta-1,6-N-acetylglucosamine synthase-like glycosyltransferase
MLEQPSLLLFLYLLPLWRKNFLLQFSSTDFATLVPFQFGSRTRLHPACFNLITAGSNNISQLMFLLFGINNCKINEYCISQIGTWLHTRQKSQLGSLFWGLLWQALCFWNKSHAWRL